MDVIQEYIDKLPDDRKLALTKLRKIISENIPDGFTETINYAMPSFVVPHSLYPKGYKCDPKLPLPFISYVSQKNFISIYHMGLYADKNLYDWFVAEYPKYSKTKADIGKSCIRFKKPEQIPYPLIAELVKKMSAQEWIKTFESNFIK